MATELHALVPSRQPLGASHAGAGYLRRAGFNIHELVGHASIFEAYSAGVLRAAPSDSSIVLLVHDDVEFDLPHTDFVALLRSQLDDAGVGFVGAAGTRNLSRELVWWRGAPSRTTLAGLVHHGASRAFFGPYGGVVMLDGLFLAARGRTLRTVRLGPPAALRRAPGWHFYDASYCLQATAAGLLNVALPLGLRHASRGVTDERWEAARAALALRLRPALPRSVGASRREARTAGSRCCCRRRRRRSRAATARCARRCAPPATSCCSCARAAMGAAGGRSTRFGSSRASRCAVLALATTRPAARLPQTSTSSASSGTRTRCSLRAARRCRSRRPPTSTCCSRRRCATPPSASLRRWAAARGARRRRRATAWRPTWARISRRPRRRSPRCGRGAAACRCTRRRPARPAVDALRAAASSPASCAPSAACTATLPAARHRCATRCAPTTPRRRCHTSCSTAARRACWLAAAVAPIVSVHLAPWPAGRCAPHAAARRGAARRALCLVRR